MRIDANLKGDLVKVKASTDSDTGTKTITAVIVTKITDTEALRILGQDFHKLAFAAFSEHEGNPVSLFKSIKPALGVEKHTVKIMGHGPFPVIPMLTGIKPCKDERAVFATFELPLLFESVEFGGKLLDKLGEQLDVSLKAAQLEIPGTEKAGIVKNNAGPFGHGKAVAI